MALIKNCVVCNSEFKTYPSINSSCCSRACSCEWKKIKSFNKYKKVCKNCGVEFLPPRQAEGGTFCSYACRGESQRLERVDRNGYWYVNLPSHPNSSSQGYVPEHHLVMEKFLGHYVEDGMIVHHIDEDRKNNDISNLSYMSDSEHKSLHAKENRGRKNGRYFNSSL